MLQPHVAPKNGFKKLHAERSISFRPERASHRRAPHVLVTVLSSILMRDVNLLGSSKVPPGQRSQVLDVGSKVVNSDSRAIDVTDGAFVAFAVASIDGTVDGCIVFAEVGAPEYVAVGLVVDCIVAASAKLFSTSSSIVGCSEGAAEVVEVGADEAAMVGPVDAVAVGVDVGEDEAVIVGFEDDSTVGVIE